MQDEELAPPATGGWGPFEADRFGAFEALAGPLYQSRERGPDEPLRIGFRVGAKHCNKAGFCHGGMMATFLDMALGLAMRAGVGAVDPSPTMTLTVDFLNAATAGDWIESRARLVHASYKTAYCDVIALGPNGPVARANAIFRVHRPKESAA